MGVFQEKGRRGTGGVGSLTHTIMNNVIIEYAGALWVAVLADGRRIAGDDLKEVTKRVYDSGGIPFVSR